MDAKLTLKLDKQVIDRAKEYASLQKRSLSRLIESYLKSLLDVEDDRSSDNIEISSFVDSLRTGVKLPQDVDEKEAYKGYISKKYE